MAEPELCVNDFGAEIAEFIWHAVEFFCGVREPTPAFEVTTNSQLVRGTKRYSERSEESLFACVVAELQIG